MDTELVNKNSIVLEHHFQSENLCIISNSNSTFTVIFAMKDLHFKLNMSVDPSSRINELLQENICIFKIYLIVYLEDALQADRLPSNTINKIAEEIMGYSFSNINNVSMKSY